MGSGVGRNSIPLAEALKDRSSKVVCVDIMQSALTKLLAYSEQFGVRGQIETYHSDIGEYEVTGDTYDYIVAVSSLEHVDSERTLKHVLKKMVQGTKINGVNCLIVNSNLQEIDALSGEELAPLMELNLRTEHL
ncbi:SAM-dependent methyltransferase [Paenibacillus oryzisoli]|uniref:SAM-dependent methyltransferase n=1 Tax=Paenibacillus oryzisoli TaxID=1850517 RepID=UPI0023D960AE|nr:class I SAM-dependent methyltransferase [Paenibacillus oryzisoli]